jgi:hypothetical protein
VPVQEGQKAPLSRGWSDARVAGYSNLMLGQGMIGDRASSEVTVTVGRSVFDEEEVCA